MLRSYLEDLAQEIIQRKPFFHTDFLKTQWSTEKHLLNKVRSKCLRTVSYGAFSRGRDHSALK